MRSHELSGDGDVASALLRCCWTSCMVLPHSGCRLSRVIHAVGRGRICAMTVDVGVWCRCLFEFRGYLVRAFSAASTARSSDRRPTRATRAERASVQAEDQSSSLTVLMSPSARARVRPGAAKLCASKVRDTRSSSSHWCNAIILNRLLRSSTD